MFIFFFFLRAAVSAVVALPSSQHSVVRAILYSCVGNKICMYVLDTVSQKGSHQTLGSNFVKSYVCIYPQQYSRHGAPTREIERISRTPDRNMKGTERTTRTTSCACECCPAGWAWPAVVVMKSAAADVVVQWSSSSSASCRQLQLLQQRNNSIASVCSLACHSSQSVSAIRSQDIYDIVVEWATRKTAWLSSLKCAKNNNEIKYNLTLCKRLLTPLQAK